MHQYRIAEEVLDSDPADGRIARSADTFSDWALANKIAFAILVRTTSNPARESDCLDFSRRHLLLHNDAARKNYLEGEDIDAIFLSAFIAGYDYVLVQAAGHYLLDKPGIRQFLEQELQAGFFFLGHILDNGDAYFSVHHQCVFLNLRVWNEIGRPEFGQANSLPKQLHVPSRSIENFHDSHTPIWVNTSTERRIYETQLEGWNFVAAGLDCNRRIAPFPRGIRHRKEYLYPEQDTNYGFNLGSCRRRATEWAEAAWVVNTEGLDGKLTGFSGPIDSLIGVASGLKTYLLLDRMGYTERTRVDYIDASEATLEFKRWLIAHWDGVDFADAIELWTTRVAPHRTLPKGTSREKIRAAADKIYLQFGGVEPFLKKWSEFRTLPHTFNKMDVLTTDVKTVVDLVPAESEHTVLWLSNIFHSYYTHTLLRHDEVRGMFRGFVTRLKARNPQAVLLCKDVHDYSIAARISDISSTVTDPIVFNRHFPPHLLKWFDGETGGLRAANLRALEMQRDG